MAKAVERARPRNQQVAPPVRRRADHHRCAEHKMLTCTWRMLVNGTFYQDPGADYYTRHHPARTKAKAIKQLQALGYTVTLQPHTDAA